MTTERRKRGGWQPGQSGNPAGRPPGAGDVAKLRASISEHIPDILAKLAERAKEGDTGAARLLLERSIAPQKPIEETVTLDMPAGSLTDQGRAVLEAISSGSLAPGQGASLLASLGTLAKLTETDELAARIAALEAKSAK